MRGVDVQDGAYDRHWKSVADVWRVSHGPMAGELLDLNVCAHYSAARRIHACSRLV